MVDEPTLNPVKFRENCCCVIRLKNTQSAPWTVARTGGIVKVEQHQSGEKGGLIMVNRKSYEERLDRLVETYGSEFETLQTAARSVDKEFQATIHGRIEHLREQYRILRERYDQLKNAEESIWEDLRIVVDAMVDEVSLSLIRILSDLVRYRYRL